MPPSTAAFRRALAGLDPVAFVRFVAALHAAREAVDAVERNGGVLVIHGRETRRLLPVADRRGPFRGPAPAGAVDPPVDEVVAQVDADGARRIATDHGARYRTPSDLYARVRYGLAPETRRRLLDEHLDVGRDDGGTVPAPIRRRGPLAAALVATLVVVAALAAGVPADPTASPASAPTPGPSADAPPSPAPVGAPSTRTARAGRRSDSVDPYPPGVGPRGVADADALSRAHAAVVGTRSYRWTAVTGRTPAVGPRTDVETTDPGDVARALADRPANATGTVSFRTYSDGNYTYVGIAGPNGSRYVRETVRVRAGGKPRYADRAGRYVARYLSGTGAGGTITRIDAVRTPVYRLTVTAPPSRIGGTISDYVATALVTRDGFVVALDVSYLRHGDDGATAVALRFRYVPYRGTADPPPWYEALLGSPAGERLLSPGAGD
ncbi:MAG: hypothetical protein ABEH78_01670 [Haloferacaceae archaeon]